MPLIASGVAEVILEPANAWEEARHCDTPGKLLRYLEGLDGARIPQFVAAAFETHHKHGVKVHRADDEENSLDVVIGDRSKALTLTINAFDGPRRGGPDRGEETGAHFAISCGLRLQHHIEELRRSWNKLRHL